MTTDVVHATRLVDQLEVDDGAVVLVESGDRARVLKVSAVALTLLTLAQGGATLRSIGFELSARFGPPSDGSIDDAVSELVDELARQGLVEVRPGG
jgi:hypothetical protein